MQTQASLPVSHFLHAEGVAPQVFWAPYASDKSPPIAVHTGITMKTRHCCALVLSLLLTGCVLDPLVSALPKRTYYLAADTWVWKDCRMFTGSYSLWVGGPETVHCFVSDQFTPATPGFEESRKRMVMFKQNSPVQIKRSFSIGTGVYSGAELLVTVPETGESTTVYSQFWSTDRLKLKEQKIAP